MNPVPLARLWTEFVHLASAGRGYVGVLVESEGSFALTIAQVPLNCWFGLVVV